MQDDFAHAIAKEIRLFGEKIDYEREIDTIYFGGGTPSLLNVQQLEIIFEQIHKTFDVRKDSEITLEANPGTIDLKFIPDYRSFGVNRISFGVQSFDDNELKFLNRIHSAEEAISSYKQIRKLGFENISLDLIFGIPKQSFQIWKKNLEITKSLDPEHISAYNLIYEPGTKLHNQLEKGKFSPLNENLEEELFLYTSDYLKEAGFEHYEVSNYAKEGFKSRHNSKYWKHVPYYGFGPSSHSFSNLERRWNFSNFEEYFLKLSQDKLPVQNKEFLTNENLFVEKIMLQLRSEGLDNDEMKKEFNFDLKNLVSNKLYKFKDYFVIDENLIKLNPKGYFIINEILISLIK